MNRHTTFIENVDARTKLVGTNQMEVLLFSLGTREVFGINVFKVREVGKVPAITRCPNMPGSVEGLVSLRGAVIPVIALLSALGLRSERDKPADTMLVAEFSKRTVAFLVHGVDRIYRIAWDHVHPADGRVASAASLVNGIIELPDGSIASMLDVEQVLADTFGDAVIPEVAPVADPAGPVFFVDDSMVARKQIIEVLDRLDVQHRHATNGLEAWERFQALAVQCAHAGKRVADEISLILVDAEMPEMDGYVLTQKIKSDPRFDGVPVIMHSSLSSEANRALGRQAGVDAYVAKFDGETLAETLRPYLQRH